MSRDECVDNDGLLENVIQQEKEAGSEEDKIRWRSSG